MRCAQFACGAFIVLLCMVVGIGSARMVAVTIPDLTAGSDAVLIGTVQDITSSLDPSGGSVETTVHIRVDEKVQGQDTPAVVPLVIRGGTAGGIHQWVEDEPVFLPGEYVGLFLKKGAQDTYRVVGHHQGKYTLASGTTPGKGTGPQALTRESFRMMVQNPAETTGSLLRAATGGATGPSITTISPSTASAGTGTRVVITGSGFGTKASRGSPADVLFYYTTQDGVHQYISATGWIPSSALRDANHDCIVSWTDTRIETMVPTGIAYDGTGFYHASAGSGPVIVQTDTSQQSAAYPFSVTFGVGTEGGIGSVPEGAKWKYAGTSVSYYVNPGSMTGARAAVQHAADTWSAAPGTSLRFSYAGISTATLPSRDGKNTLAWANLNDPPTIAQASLFWDATGYIVESDVVFNTQYAWSTMPGDDAMDIETSALHELGHWLHLRDLYGDVPGYPQDTAKVMFGIGGNGKITRTLHSSDAAGIAWLYPAGAAPAITLTAPDGGEKWQQGTSHPITWSYSGTPGAHVKIVLLKGSTVTATITSSTPIGSLGHGSYPWTIPSTLAVGNDYRIGIVSTTLATAKDTSTTYFTINPKDQTSITVTSPNGLEQWKQGSPHTITWSYTGTPGTNVKIVLLKGSTVTATITPSTPVGSGGSGSFPWTPTQAAGSDYRIGIVSTTQGTVKDTSNTYFTIEGNGGTLTLTAPNGGENWARNTRHTITWTYTGSPGPVRIELWKNKAYNSVIVASTAPGSGGAGSYIWTIPSGLATGSDYRVKIFSTGNGAITDLSNANFVVG